MDLIKVNKKIIELMDEHGLIDKGWTFAFDRAVKRLGQCVWMKKGVNVKQITMSKIMSQERPDDEVINTMLHEIAHALDYENRGTSDHGSIWKSIALSIGCNAERCSTSTVDKMKVYKWVGVCPEHGVLGGWQRKPNNNKICRKCGSKVTITENKERS